MEKMYQIKPNLILSFFFLLSTFSVMAQAVGPLPEADQQYEQRMKWFSDAKYGMFIHFGLYSQLGGEWKGETVKGYSEWIQANVQMEPAEYDNITASFNPTNFNAEAIVKLAKKAGMKYIVITTKHHDGFCLWDSKFTDFDIARTPFKRDILKELSDACKKHGIKFGTYYSIIDWHHPSQYVEKSTEKTESNYANPKMKPDQKQVYVTYMKNQIKELIDRYDTDLFWFDADWVNWWTNETGIDLYNYIRTLKPSIIINNRVAKRKIFKKDYDTPEQKHFDKPVDYKWESCYTMNTSFGYKSSDTAWKKPEKIYELLTEINKNGGNLLLNVGPDGTGKIPKPSVKILLKVGKMLKKANRNK
jgi:alpha-L-fucosidase